MHYEENIEINLRSGCEGLRHFYRKMLHEVIEERALIHMGGTIANVCKIVANCFKLPKRAVAHKSVALQ